MLNSIVYSSDARRVLYLVLIVSCGRYDEYTALVKSGKRLQAKHFWKAVKRWRIAGGNLDTVTLLSYVALLLDMWACPLVVFSFSTRETGVVCASVVIFFEQCL